MAIAALYALAMVTLGIAHQPASQNQPSAELAEYTLPDGTAPILCSGAASGTDEGHTAPKSTHCDACTLITGPGIVGEPPVVGSACLVSPAIFYLTNYAYHPVVRASDYFLSRAPPSMA